MNIQERMRATLDAEAEAIRSVHVTDEFVQAVEVMQRCDGKIITTGIGKAGHIAEKFAATLCSTCTPAVFVHAAEAAHGDLGIVDDHDVMIAFSTSGKSREVLEILELARHLGVATIIGMVREEMDFRGILRDDVLCIGTDNSLTPYSRTNNNHYEEMESRGVDMSDPAEFDCVTQSSRTGVPAAATAGVMTTRAAAKAFFIDGTNRAMFRFTLLNHMCRDLEQVKDTTRSADHIRQDISRSPGGCTAPRVPPPGWLSPRSAAAARQATIHQSAASGPSAPIRLPTAKFAIRKAMEPEWSG